LFCKGKNQSLTELHTKLIKNYIAHNIYCYFLNYFLIFCKNAVKIAVCSTILFKFCVKKMWIAKSQYLSNMGLNNLILNAKQKINFNDP